MEKIEAFGFAVEHVRHRHVGKKPDDVLRVITHDANGNPLICDVSVPPGIASEALGKKVRITIEKYP